MNTEKIGISALSLGAGRETKDSALDLLAGIKVLAKTGDKIKCGDTLAVLFASDEAKLKTAEKIYKDALSFSKEPVKRGKIIYKTLS